MIGNMHVGLAMANQVIAFRALPLSEWLCCAASAATCGCRNTGQCRRLRLKTDRKSSPCFIQLAEAGSGASNPAAASGNALPRPPPGNGRFAATGDHVVAPERKEFWQLNLARLTM